MMNAVLWILATLVTEWALKTIWRDYIEPPLVRRSHAKAAADREDEAREREYFASIQVDPETITRIVDFHTHLEQAKRRPSPGPLTRSNEVAPTFEERIARLAERVERALGGPDV